MRTLYGFIARLLHRKRIHLESARVGLIEQIANSKSVAVDTNMRPCRLKLRGDCTHVEAIAEIEDHLRGTRSNATCGDEDPFLVGRHRTI
jgi:hypothetical protein